MIPSLPSTRRPLENTATEDDDAGTCEEENKGTGEEGKEEVDEEEKEEVEEEEEEEARRVVCRRGVIPAKIFNKVDFPLPEGPINATTCPDKTRPVMFDNTGFGGIGEDEEEGEEDVETRE